MTNGEPLDLSDVDLRGSHFANSNLANAVFVDVDLSAARFDDVKAASTTFTDVDLSKSRFTNVDLQFGEISNCRLAGLRIDGILVTDLFAAYRKLQSP
jgi:uncharacterized protein YjbI with pentapeptide repeats